MENSFENGELIGKQEGIMQRLVSHIPDLVNAKGWDKNTFEAYCKLGGISDTTADRLYGGDVVTKTTTLAVIAEVLGVKSISSLIDIIPEQ